MARRGGGPGPLLLRMLALHFLLQVVASVTVYPFLASPDENPQMARHHFRPPPPRVLGNRTRFAALRGFSVNSSGYAVNYEQDLSQILDQVWELKKITLKVIN